MTYLLVLAGIVLVTLPLGIWTGVYAQWKRLALTLLPVLAVFLAWDGYAIARGHWQFDPAQTTGVRIGSVPLEELLFFVAVPVASVIALEAVRKARGWDYR
jgi:lycopene cyclase domain-containing protein